MIPIKRKKALLASIYYSESGSLTPLSDGARYAGYCNPNTFMNHPQTKEILSPLVARLEEISQLVTTNLKDCLTDESKISDANAKDMAVVLSTVNKEIRLFRGEATENIKSSVLRVHIPEELDD